MEHDAKETKPDDLLWTIIEPYWASEPMLMIVERSSYAYWDPRTDALECATWSEIESDHPEDVYFDMCEAAGFSGMAAYAEVLRAVDALWASVADDEDFDEDELSEAIDALYEDADLPIPSDTFDRHQFGPHGDGDWPPHPGALMHQDLPEEIIERFAETTETIFNGTYAFINASRRAEVLAALQESGLRVLEEPGLGGIAYAYG